MPRLRVLHVDDQRDVREIVQISLGLDPAFETRSCASGPEALAVAANWRPDIGLIDVLMPGMDGRETLAHLRRNTETAYMPIIFITGRAPTQEVAHFRSLGVVAVILKPFDPMTLAISVHDCLSAKAQIDELRGVFIQRVIDDAAVLMKHRTMLRSGMTDPNTLLTIRNIAHSLAGAGGMFNLPNISDAAALVEEAVIVRTMGSGSIKGVAEALDRLLGCMDQAAGRS